MKAIITDSESGKETIVSLDTPHITKDAEWDWDPDDEEDMRELRECTINEIIRNIYKVVFDKSKHPNIFELDPRIPIPYSNLQTFILSPHADMVREEHIYSMSKSTRT